MMTSAQTIELSAARGRPMLHWVGKKPLDHVPVFPAQRVERFDPAGDGEEENLLVHGDNKDVLAWLLAHGYRQRIDLIYIDPPFDSGADYVRRVGLRGVDSEMLTGQPHDLGEQVQYTDIWVNDAYLQFMYERLLLLRELLAATGCIYLHCDHRKEHYLRLLLEEVFGAENFLNTISWRSQVARGAKVNAFYLPFSTHYILIFARDRSQTTWNPPKKRIILSEEEAAQSYMRDERGFFRTSDPGSYSFARLRELHAAGRLYAPFGGDVVIDAARERVYGTRGGSIAVKYYLQPVAGGRYAVERALDNLWDDLPGLGTTPGENVGYPTQKTEALLQRILAMSTNPGDTVLDCFVGSGTTAAVAQKMGRRWIAADINRGAIQTTSKRLQAVIAQQCAAAEEGATDAENVPAPATRSFTMYRINNYDLAIPHSEAMQLIRDHVGITPARDDPFFDGTRGERLVTIVPLQRPLNTADLEAVQRELAARPQETRDLLVVCLGKETDVDAWLDAYHAQRPLQRMAVIELRTDAQYGRFLAHQPATARVRIERRNETLHIEIDDFISPTIVQRLELDAAQMGAYIPDWRAMVDSVQIDTAYDGATFHIALSDVPARKDEWVAGCYTLPAPADPTRVAVKIIDMLGEEVLITETV